MEKYCISIDWLQVCGYARNLELLDTPPSELCGYAIEVVPNGTRTFTKMINVCRVFNSDLIPLATIQCFPRSSALKKELCIVKMANRTLYSQETFHLLTDILSAFRIVYKGITRIDFCYDCNRFKGGLLPERFLRRYLSTPFESPKYIYRKNTKKFSVHISRNKSGSQRVEYVKWGSDSSNKCCYIYDKTLELNEVKDKPWIRETWEKNGLISNDETHVWRCEISIKSDGMDLINLDTGQLFKLNPEYLYSQGDMEKLFYFYAAQMFCFSRRNRHKRVRDFDRVELFEAAPVITCKPIQTSRKADTGRTDLICARRLEALSRTYTDASAQFVKALKQSIEFLYTISGNRRCIIDITKKIDYLNTLKGFRWRADMDYEYFALIEALRLTSKDIKLDLSKLYPEYCSDPEEDNSLLLYADYLAYCRENFFQP